MFAWRVTITAGRTPTCVWPAPVQWPFGCQLPICRLGYPPAGAFPAGASSRYQRNSARMLPSKLPLSSLHLPVFPGRASCLLILLVALVDLVWLGVTDITLPAPQFLQIMATLAVEVMLMRVLQRRLAAGSVHGRLFGTFAVLLKAISRLQHAWVPVRVVQQL